MSANLFAVSAEQAVEAMDAVGGPHAAISGGGSDLTTIYMSRVLCIMSFD